MIAMVAPPYMVQLGIRLAMSCDRPVGVLMSKRTSSWVLAVPCVVGSRLLLHMRILGSRTDLSLSNIPSTTQGSSMAFRTINSNTATEELPIN